MENINQFKALSPTSKRLYAETVQTVANIYSDKEVQETMHEIARALKKAAETGKTANLTRLNQKMAVAVANVMRVNNK